MPRAEEGAAAEAEVEVACAAVAVAAACAGEEEEVEPDRAVVMAARVHPMVAAVVALPVRRSIAVPR